MVKISWDTLQISSQFDVIYLSIVGPTVLCLHMEGGKGGRGSKEQGADVGIFIAINCVPFGIALLP